MSIQSNQYPSQTQLMIQDRQQDPKMFFSSFQNNFQIIKAFVEDLKQLPIQVTEKQDSNIAKYTQTIINYLQHPNALNNQKLYRNSLIGLGNFLSIKYSFLKKEFLSQKFFKNLIQYFSILCEKQTQQDFNMLVYPVFYLIVLIIYNSDKQITSILHSKLFVKKFLKALSSVQFKQGNKIQKYLPVIIAFVSKGSHTSETSTLLKMLVLNNLHFSEREKNQFHFIYSLRILINKQSFTLAEIRKYGLLEYLVNYLQKNITCQQTTSMVLEVLKHILKRHHILSYKLIASGFLSTLDTLYEVNSCHVLSLLETICPCIPYNYKQKILEVHTEMLRKYRKENINSMSLKQLESIKIISIIISEISFNDLLIFLENYSIQNLLERTFKGQKKFTVFEEQDVINLLTKILKCMSVENKSIGRYFLSTIFEYRKQNKNILTLIDCYKREFEAPLNLM